MFIAVLFQRIGAAFTTGNNINVGAGQQMFNDGMEIILCQFAVKTSSPSLTTQPPFSATNEISLASSGKKEIN